MMQTTTRSAEETLAHAETVLHRLTPLTHPGVPFQSELHEHLAAAWQDRMQALAALGRPAEAVAAADQWLGHLGAGSDDAPLAAAVEHWPFVARAMHGKAKSQAAAGDIQDALATFGLLQERFRHTEAPGVREWLARAGLAEIDLRARHGTTFARVDMVRWAEQLVERHGADAWPDTQATVARIRLRKGLLLAELDYPDDALAEWGALCRDGAGWTQDALREVAADAQLERARLLARLGRWDDAWQANEALIAAHAGARHPGTLETLALAHQDRIHGWRQAHWTPPDGSSAQAEAILACEAMEAAFAQVQGPALMDRCLGQCQALHARMLREQADAIDEDGTHDTDEAAGIALRERARSLAEALWTRCATHPDAPTRLAALTAWCAEIDESVSGSDARLEAWQAVLQRVGDDPAPQLQAPLMEVWVSVAEIQRHQGRPEAALATLEAMARRFEHAARTEPEARRRAAHLAALRARWLDEAGRTEEALALLDTFSDAPADEEADRWLHVALLDTRAELWARQTPPAPPRQDGTDETGTRLHATPTAAEQHHAQAVVAMAERFGRDDSPRIRTRVAGALHMLAAHQREHLHFEAACDRYRQLIALYADDRPQDIAHRVASAHLNLAYLLMVLLDRPAEALPVYDALLARYGHHSQPPFQETLAKASASRLTCLNRLQHQGVDVSYGESLEDLPVAERDALQALLDEARALSGKGRHREAVGLYDRLIGAHGESAHPELRRLCLDALVNKGYCLGRLGQREQALAVNDGIIARYGHERNTSTEKDVALAYSNKAVQLERLGRHDEELATYDEIVARWSGSTVDYLRMRVANAMFAKALAVASRDPEAGESLYRATIARWLDAPETDVRLQAAKCAPNLAALLRRRGRPGEAVAVCEAALAQLAAQTHPDLRAQMDKMRVQVARGCREAGRHEAAVAAYRVLLDAPPASLSLSDALLVELRREYAALGASRSWREKTTNALVRMFHKR